MDGPQPEGEAGRMSAPKTPATRRATHPSRRYEIRVRGGIGATLLAAFPELTATRAGPDTVLSGLLADQSALYGVIHQLEALALELVEVRSLPSVVGPGPTFVPRHRYTSAK